MSFKYLNQDRDLFDADDAEDLHASKSQLDSQLDYYKNTLDNLPKIEATEDKIDLLLKIAAIQIERSEAKDAWDKAFEAFHLAEKENLWELAVKACNVLFLAEGPDSLVALGHGLWLGITFPIDAELTVMFLEHLIKESPKESDTCAVAAASAHYIANIRLGVDDDLTFFTNQMLASVADNHSYISDQRSFNVWQHTLELDNPKVFLKKLSNAINQLVGDNWWIDKKRINALIDAEQKFNT